VAAGSIVSSGFAALLTTILGAELGSEGFGTYAFVIATAGLIGIVARAGLGPIVVRDIARSVDEDAPSGRRDPILAALAVTAVLSLVLALITLSPLGVKALEAAGDLDVTLAGALAVLFTAQAVYTVNAEALRGLHHLGSAAFLGLAVQRLISLVLVAWVVYVAADDLDPELAVWLTAAAAAAATVVSGFALWRRLRRLPGKLPPRSTAAMMTRDGAPVLLTDALGLAGTRLPIWVLAFLGALDEAGVFALATAYVVLIRLAHKTMIGTLAPFVASSYHSGSREDLQRRVRVAAAATGLGALAAGAGLLVAGTVAVPRLFGSGFDDAVPVAAILLIGTLTTALAGPCGLLLNVTGNERWTAKASLVSVGLAAVAIFPAGAAGGAVGAAAVMATATVLRIALQLRFAVRETGILTVADFGALLRSVRGLRR
jgi:O-antigen/teichoic acid export membrane protein